MAGRVHARPVRAVMDSMDLVIAEYKKDADVTLIDECLKRTVEEPDPRAAGV